MAVRRHVSNEEFNKALKNPDNASVIRAVCLQFAKTLSIEELRSCGLNALWRALSYHQDGKGNKFTTSLFRFVRWECSREIRRLNNYRKHVVAMPDNCDVSDETDTDIVNLRESIRLLPEQHKDILHQYYFDNRTMEEIGVRNGYSKESARQKINKALAELRELCQAT